ncbi:hypothetical protein T12_14327 [Trichinella patagoniensis]|uniref:Uncharacterized protein n=1 Tax=Trichinella patagoniensis TaxID=990121 RepID=A0A0V0Z546_9BILA|nr:hypothetical protein T12_14327 [Trichinella patagoniensis]
MQRIYWERGRPPDPLLSGVIACRFRTSVVRRRDLPGWSPSCFCSPCVLPTLLQRVCHADEDVPSFIHTQPTLLIGQRNYHS